MNVSHNSAYNVLSFENNIMIACYLIVVPELSCAICAYYLHGKQHKITLERRNFTLTYAAKANSGIPNENNSTADFCI
jgi:hypothetical protein